MNPTLTEPQRLDFERRAENGEEPHWELWKPKGKNKYGYEAFTLFGTIDVAYDAPKGTPNGVVVKDGCGAWGKKNFARFTRINAARLAAEFLLTQATKPFHPDSPPAIPSTQEVIDRLDAECAKLRAENERLATELAVAREKTEQADE